MVIISESRSLKVLLRLFAVSLNLLKRLLGSGVVFCGMVRSKRSCVPQRRDCEKKLVALCHDAQKEQHTFSSQRFLAGKIVDLTICSRGKPPQRSQSRLSDC